MTIEICRTEQSAITGKSRPLEPEKFEFTRVFQQDSSNDEVFEELKPLVTLATSGAGGVSTEMDPSRHTAIICYGWTGSGKSFTHLHSEAGILSHTIRRLSKSGCQMVVVVREIYNN